MNNSYLERRSTEKNINSNFKLKIDFHLPKNIFPTFNKNDLIMYLFFKKNSIPLLKMTSLLN